MAKQSKDRALAIAIGFATAVFSIVFFLMDFAEMGMPYHPSTVMAVLAGVVTYLRRTKEKP